jgi:Putative zinc-finger
MDDRACGNFSERLVLYHYGELSREQASEVAVHVLSCDSCREELEGLTHMLSNVPGPGKPSSGEVYAASQGVMRRLFRHRPFAIGKLLPLYLTAAAVIAAIFFATYLPDMGNRPPQLQDIQVATATTQGDFGVLDNMDVIGDLDVIQQIDRDGLDEIGPIRD